MDADNLGSRSALADLFDLRGKAALVTAAGQGMGRGIAHRLAEAGANVIVSHKRLDDAQRVAEEIRSRGGCGIAVETDVAVLDHIDRTVRAGMDEFGAIDILVNVAGGIYPRTAFLETTPELYSAAMARNIDGAYFMSQRVARTMAAANRPGRIVNIASTAAFRPDFELSAYNIAKSGVLALTTSLCSELAVHRILVNAVVPGPIRTTNTAPNYDKPQVQRVVADKVPLGHPGTPDDIANAVLFCASPASGFMTGASIVIDGGYMWTRGF
ncbi:SDR family oxidoreductase [Sphingomonadaceae bacterium G21617-S1]|nr:SDR family oxidoreductase [Sphingomonadaceae bacterium G21617-S1]